MYGKPVEYVLTLGKSVSDVYDYENIRVVLQSRCDPVNVYSEVFLSAHFVPSCSEVEVTAPLTNWVYNNKTAYNIDETIKFEKPTPIFDHVGPRTEGSYTTAAKANQPIKYNAPTAAKIPKKNIRVLFSIFAID